MPLMVVTLEVSKLSGWSNSDAYCRESKGGGHTVRGGVRPERRRTTAAQAACGGELDCRLGAGHGAERTANMPNVSVTLEVSKLSSWLNANAPCRESNGGHTVRPEGAGQQTEVTASSVQWRVYCRLGTEQTWSAHPEHLTHVCDAGGIPVGNVRVDVLQVVEEPVHVGDG